MANPATATDRHQYGEGFKSEFAARLAGLKALQALVSQIKKQ
jgi:hypothetical protein